jgi:hypothetical protein
MHVKPPRNAKVWIGVWIGDCDVGAVGCEFGWFWGQIQMRQKFKI